MKKALTIAGSDPSGGAGIQADLKVFHVLGVYGLSVVSSLTAQNTRGVDSVLPVKRQFIKRQLEVLLSDLTPGATKTGMLYTEAAVEEVAYIVRRYSLPNLVIDPVILSSTGKRLARKGVPDAIRRKILPLCSVITPNIHEASVLSGIEVSDREGMKKAAICLRDMGCESVIITGGHLEKIALDILYDGDFHYFRSRKLSGEFHGTGCTFSAALTAFLARGYNVTEATGLAKKFMRQTFIKSSSEGSGMRLLHI